jgi:hypothetical protein
MPNKACGFVFSVFCRKTSAAEMNGHFMSAAAELAGANHFAGVRVAVVTGPENLNLAGLAHRQGIFQKEGDTADGGIAGRDIVGRVGQRAVEDGQAGMGLDRPAIIATAIDGRYVNRQRGRWTDVKVTH